LLPPRFSSWDIAKRTASSKSSSKANPTSGEGKEKCPWNDKARAAQGEFHPEIAVQFAMLQYLLLVLLLLVLLLLLWLLLLLLLLLLLSSWVLYSITMSL